MGGPGIVPVPPTAFANEAFQLPWSDEKAMLKLITVPHGRLGSTWYQKWFGSLLPEALGSMSGKKPVLSVIVTPDVVVDSTPTTFMTCAVPSLRPVTRTWTSSPGWMTGGSGLVYDSFLGLIAINVAFQTGFCTFVLSNYMKTIPASLGEAARVDGASIVRQFFGIILPLCKPALAALATLEFTWIYNDFLWAVVLMSSGDKRPITSSLTNLQGTFFTDNNLISAASVLVALPTIVVFLALQRQFISGLTLGANKG